MAIPRGSKVGHYEVLEPLGAGGMGEVYRAHDSRLGRDVALKVLSEPFKLDPHRLARFTREARVLASLNHPNIGTLLEVARHGDTDALVLELVEGETLAERIARGPPPLAETLSIARQIAAALETAHSHGVIHRDLKPANVKLRADGHVKLLDFGLAKTFAADAEAGSPAAVTATALDVHAGTPVMGTPAYMSPEQARGLTVDQRTDVWAFGCVLYEMLAGAAAFPGDRASEVIAKVLEREPDWRALPDSTPPPISRLLERCLAKDPRKRLRDIGDARLEIEQASAASGERRITRHLTERRAAGVAVAVLLAGAGAWGLGRLVAVAVDSSNPPAAGRSIARFVVAAPVEASPWGRTIAISPDGRRIAYVGPQGLYIRALDELEPTRVAGVDQPNAGAPFFSPDGRWLGFADGQNLKKVPVGGGTPTIIAEAGPTALATWTPAGIFFASMAGLFKVSADGGTPERLPVELAPLEQALHPQLLPGGRTLLYTVIPTRTIVPTQMVNAPGARVETLDLSTGERRTVVRGGGRAHYAPTGHLLYAAGDSLHAVAFDAARGTAAADSAAVLTNVRAAEFALAEDGTIAYLSGPAGARQLVWVDRDGREEPVTAPPMEYVYPRLSPDGSKIALDIGGPDRDVFIFDLQRGVLERFTHDPAGNPLVAWSRDGQWLAFGSERFGIANMLLQAANGSGEPARLLPSDRVQMPMSFAPDGRLVYSADVQGRGRDILAVTLDGTAAVQSLVHSVSNEFWGEVSPEGRWIAYDSDESGRFEVYVRPYPSTESGRWQISSGGGRQPMWSHDGRELFYRDFAGALLAVSVAPENAFSAGPPVVILDNPAYIGGGASGSGRTFDLSPDGRRFLMIKAQSSAPSIVVITNWFEELERLSRR